MTFPVPRPKAQPAPSKAPIRYVRGAAYDRGTQPPHFRTGRMPTEAIDAVVRDTARALMHAKQDRSNAVSKRAA